MSVVSTRSLILPRVVGFVVVVLLASSAGKSQQPSKWAAAEAALAKANFTATASALTIYDRDGKVVRTIGERGQFSWLALSPDGTRLATVRSDETDQNDIWVFDLSTGASMQITSDSAADTAPVWSPDGRQIIYVSDRSKLYRKAANGTGSAEIVYQHPDTLSTTDWSADGRFLAFSSGTGLYVLPLDASDGGALSGPENRKAVQIFPFAARVARFSPDGRFLAYDATNMAGTRAIWIRTFDPAEARGNVVAARSWISDQGAAGSGGVSWRGDGKELYYLSSAGAVMAVEIGAGELRRARGDDAIGTTPEFRFGPPRLLFQAPNPVVRNAMISRDGQQFVFSVRPPQPAPQPITGEHPTLVLNLRTNVNAATCSNATLKNVVFDAPDSVAAYYKENSYSMMNLPGNVAGPYTVGAWNNCDRRKWATEAKNAAEADGIVLSDYRHLIYIMPPESINQCSFGGTSEGRHESWVVGRTLWCSTKQTMSHELGHNLGLGHSNTPTEERGDHSSTMGSDSNSINPNFNAPAKEAMGWLPGVVQIVRASGNYRVALLQAASADMKTLKIAVPGSATDFYYLSYRRAVGLFDGNLKADYVDKTSVHRWGGTGPTILLANLADGQSFSQSGITVTQARHDDTFAYVTVVLPPSGTTAPAQIR